MKSSFVFASCILSSASLTAAVRYPNWTNWTVGQPVDTTSGYIYGYPGSTAPNVSTYLGIPYAQPPVGDLRFAPPQIYRSYSSIHAAAFGPSCPISSNFGGSGSSSSSGQSAAIKNANLTILGDGLANVLAQVGDTFSEDCLTLNVWAKPQTGEKKKAVLVWLPAGGFTSGASSKKGNDGQKFADEEDVVVVSFNYRTNIYGFPGAPSIPNNLGLLDQRLAIEWVYSNIAAFGGDPSRMTLFGDDAGAASIDFYSYAWTSSPIVSGMILQSGTTALGAYNQSQSAAAWYNVTETVGCGNASSPSDAVLSCMRTKNATEITAAIPLPAGVGGSAAFWPTIDETVVFSDYGNRSAEGKFIQVPMLIGNTDYEGGFQATFAAISGTPQPVAYWAGFSDEAFNCPASWRANASINAGIPTWRYRYFGDWDNLRLTTVPSSGAYHASELAVLFGDMPPVVSAYNASCDICSSYPATEAELEVGNYMRGAWSAFAKDPIKGLVEGYGWPTYRPGSRSLVRLAYGNSTGLDLELPGVYDAGCQEVLPA